MTVSGDLKAVGALGVAAAITFVATPVAIRVAKRTGFLDRPGGHKAHAAPVPYLGGAAVVAGVAVSTIALGGTGHRLMAAIGGAAALLALGTLDDHRDVPPLVRVAAEVAVACGLAAAGAGWSVFHSDVANLAVTIGWVVGVVNAFNLMDNLDGAAATVAAAAAASIGALALLRDDTATAALAFAVAGACLAFLPRNLSRPARIFLGDGGSMPVGMLVATGAMLACRHGGLGASNLAAGALFAGLPLFDVALVVISRRRRGVSIMTGGRDHLTYRLLAHVGSPRRVALALAALQLLLGGLATAGSQAGTAWLLALFAAVAALSVVALVALESPRHAWRAAMNVATPGSEFP